MKTLKSAFLKKKQQVEKEDTSADVSARSSERAPDSTFGSIGRRSVSEIEFNSPTRSPLPKCHPETRKGFRGRVMSWLDDPDRNQNILWITGPACAGKTVVAQTIAEHCQQSGRLGAALFITHRSQQTNDFSRIIATLVHQLALYDSAFRQAVSEILLANPQVFDKGLAVQFRMLVVEPSKVFVRRKFFDKRKPPIIILDGIDRCKNIPAQIEFLELVDNYINHTRDKSPFSWVICSRPVRQWSRVLLKERNQHEQLSIADPEAVGDVYKYILSDGFQGIRSRYPHLFGSEVWPTEEELAQVSRATSGFFSLALDVLHFIGDEGRRDPKAQLKLCLGYLNGALRPREHHPFSSIYLVYQRILTDINPDILSTTMNILGLCISGPSGQEFSVQEVSRNLDIDLPALHRAVEGIQAVLHNPFDESNAGPLEFFHSSFIDFLTYRINPLRIGLSLNEFQRNLSGASGDAMELSLVMLLANVLPDVELDSPARFPLSRCHRGTRKHLRNRVATWLINSDREEHILWITGPAGVGKSTVAQSIAEHCHQTGRLGAALFFSHAGQSDDIAERVIPTLACQLALRLPDYKAVLAAALVDNAGITEKDLHAQFLELIARPLKKLQRRRLLFSAQNPLVIVLDALDLCGGKAVQTDLVNLITAFTQEFLAIGLLWIFCCRPEPRLRKSVWRTDALGLSRHEVLSMDDVEARDDVEIILRDGLHDIRKKYLYRFGPMETWPTPVHWWRLMKATSGFYMFASGILEYVGDEHQMDPRALLELCLEFIENSLVPHTLHPFHTLDSLYKQITLPINLDSLPLTTCILGLCVHHSSDGLTVPDIMNLLGIDQRTLNNALDGLHSVVHVPAPGADREERIRFYHPSFSDFLKDPNRSGQIAQQILAYKEDPYCYHSQQPSTRASASGSRANIARLSTQAAESSSRIDDHLSVEEDPFQGGEPATALQLQLARGPSSCASSSSSNLENSDFDGIQTTSRD